MTGCLNIFEEVLGYTDLPTKLWDVSSSHPFLTYNHHEQRCDLAKGSTKGLLERRKKISFLPFFNLSLSYALPTFPFFIFFCTLICERVNYRMNNVQYSKLNLIAFSLPYKKRKSQACIWWIEEKSYPNLEEFWLALIMRFLSTQEGSVRKHLSALWQEGSVQDLGVWGNPSTSNPLPNLPDLKEG